MLMANSVVIEKAKRLSESCLWDLQRKYFDEEGIHAWVGQVPYFVSSNPFLADGYAHIIIRFIKDYIFKHKAAMEYPFYILELGTGSGKFSFYLLKRICELRESLGLQDIQIRYVMSDFTASNLRFWKTHESLKPYVEAGLLDFSIYNMEKEEPIHLVNADQSLSPALLKNPLIVCANYIFDTVSHDAFRVHNEVLEESLVTLTTESDNMRGDQPVDYQKIHVDYVTAKIGNEYYQDRDFDAVLAHYLNVFAETTFLMPMGALKALRYLMRLSENKLLLLSSDKGYAQLEEMDRLGPPSVAFHGSFSLMVNFEAIAQYFQQKGGDYVLQTPRRGLKTCVFGVGFKFEEMWDTKTAIDTYVQGVAPCDYFNYHRFMSDNFEKCEVATLASHLNFSKWDPYVFNKFAGYINKNINDEEYSVKEYLVGGMRNLANNFYFMPDSIDYLFDIGLFFHTLKDYKQGIAYYEQSIRMFGDQFNAHYNLGLCYYYLGESPVALTHFKKSLECDTSSKEAKEWIEFVEQELNK